MADLPNRVDVVGTGISAAGVDETVDLILHPGSAGLSVAVCNVHAVMLARSDARLREALVDADIATADGTPLVWALRAMGAADQERVDGLKLFLATVEAGLAKGSRHFFYGSTQATLDRMVDRLLGDYPEIVISGTMAPAFRELSEDEIQGQIASIRASDADVVWVGLGMPKQELWMTEAGNHLPGVSLVGVGAVFDWVAGSTTKAPAWMQQAGLEWLYRLAREPRRLWKRYAWNNPAYLVLLAIQLMRVRLRRR